MIRNITNEFYNLTLPNNPTDKCLQQQRQLEQNKDFTTTIALFNVPLCLTALVGNSVVLIAIWKTPSLHSPTNILLANLAVSDFGVGLIGQPLDIMFLLTAAHGFPSISRALCTGLNNVIGYFLSGVSFLTISAMGLDRLLALQLHLRYNSVITGFRTILSVIAIWVCVALMSLLWLGDFQNGISLVTIGSVLLAADFLIYLKIYFIARHHQAQIQHQQPQVNDGNIIRAMRMKTSIVNTFFVFILMICCYVPHMLVFAVGRPSIVIYYITSTIVNLNSTLYPFLCSWRVKELRSAIKPRFCR